MEYIVIFKCNSIINIYPLSKMIHFLHTISTSGLLYNWYFRTSLIVLFLQTGIFLLDSYFILL